MLRKLLITPWFGPLPSWFDLYGPNIGRLEAQGFDWLPVYDLDAFSKRVQDKLGFKPPIVAGESKVHDYRACLGELFEEELEGYDFWGHTDFDCIYGRLGHFIPDELLAGVDIYSDCCQYWKSYICGPLAFFRNAPELRSFYRQHPSWEQILRSPEVSGWVEMSFTDMIDNSDLRVHYQEQHVFLPEDLKELRWDGEKLMLRGQERSMAHFRRTKVYPQALR